MIRGFVMRRKLLAAALIVALLAAGFYFRPLSFLFFYRDLVLWSRGAESRFVKAGPHRLHYLSQGEGRPLVILPGLMTRGADASPLMAAFAPRRRVIALDLLGQGDSASPDIAYSIRQQGDAVIAFLETTRTGPADLLGVSMGGWVALDVAARRPDLVRNLILASSGGLRFETSLTPRSFAPQDVDELYALMRLQSPNPPERLPRFIARDAVRQLKRSEWVTLRAARSMISWRDAYDGRLGGVKVRTLVYWGDQDRLIPLDVGRRLAAGIPDARLVVSPGCGHLAVLECKDSFVAAATRFLDDTADKPPDA